MFLPFPPQILIAVILVALSATGGSWITAKIYQGKADAQELKNRKLVEQLNEKNRALSVAGADLSNMIFERDQARLQEIQIVERKVYVNIIKYRDRPAPRPIDGVCYLDSEWVRIYNTSLSAGMPEASTSAAESDKAATYADALDSVTDNIATCNGYRATILSWQEYYEGLRRLYNETYLQD